MDDLETLIKEIHRKEKKQLFHKFLFGNILLVLIISISLSGTRVTERERELLSMYKEVSLERDSLKAFYTTELITLKERENKIIRKSLSINMDTSYIDSTLTINNMYWYAEAQLSTYDNIEDVVNGKWDSINSIPTGIPITLADLYEFNDGFGYRKHPIIKKILFHEGTDLSALVGSEVFATGNGIVEKVIPNDRGYGNRIVINHQNGYKTVYAHLDKFKVSVGQRIKKYDVIGTVGNTGSSTGSHLHYEILIKNRPIDPYKYFYIETSNRIVFK